MQDTKCLSHVSTAVVLFTIRETLQLLLTQGTPSQLPNATLTRDEGLDTCAKRALADACGAENVFLEQLYTFNEPGEVPSVVVGYYALVPHDRVDVRPGSCAWRDPASLPPIGDQQRRIVACACARLAAKLQYAPIAYQFLADQFTLAELQDVYEIISQKPLDKRNFRRRLRSSPYLVETRETRRGGAHRPAKLYRLRDPMPGNGREAP